MRMLFRTALAIVMITIAAVTIHRYSYTPLRCNSIENYVERRTLHAFTVTSGQSMVSARQNLQTISECDEILRTNVNYYMIRAANFRILGDRVAAAREYQRALSYDRRPEIYFNLGSVLIEDGKTAAGEDALLSAAISNPKVIDEIAYDDVRELIRRRTTQTFALWERDRPREGAISPQPR